MIFRLLAIAALLVPLSAFSLDGRVVSISDGDTITVLDASNQQHKIRVMGIDAPEKAQPFGQKSKSNVGTLAFGREANYRYDATS